MRCLKTYSKRLIKKEDLKRLYYEINLLMSCDHPIIIKVYDWFEDEDRVMMVTEICTGGDLHDKMVEKKKSRFEE
jgi:calcium-dependent protein kinase